jgi:DNA-binding winged helix-turn-helix (wHTH) protein
MIQPNRGVYTFGPFVLEPDQHRLQKQGEPVKLPPKAFDLLVVLVTRAGDLVTKEQLLKEVWDGAFVEEANLSVNMTILRRALGDDYECIETVPRRGYRFIAAVTSADRASSDAGSEALAAPPVAPAITPPARNRWRNGAVAGLAVVALALAYGAWAWTRPAVLPAEVSMVESLSPSRCCSAAVTLTDGEVIVFGGIAFARNSTRESMRRFATKFDPVTGKWLNLKSMAFFRAFPTATRLKDGRILVAGGYGCLVPPMGQTSSPCRPTDSWQPLASAEVYDPTTGNWTPLTGGRDNSGMLSGHADHTATLLPDGTVLIVGGYHSRARTAAGDWGTDVELFDPKRPEGQQFLALAPITDSGCSNRRANHTATLLQNGSVLIAGGAASGNACETYLTFQNGERGLQTLAVSGGSGAVIAGRSSHTATLLDDGRVLFTGGVSRSGQDTNAWLPLRSTAIFDPVTGRTIAGPTLSAPRTGHTATRVDGGAVVLVGGMACAYDNEQVVRLGPMYAGRPYCEANDSADVFLADGRSGNVTSFKMAGGQAYQPAALLIDGSILLPGGLSDTTRATDIVEKVVIPGLSKTVR